MERDFHKIRGGTTDEKFSNLETMLRRMSRRLVNESKAVIPPIPVFGFVQEPVDSVITRCLIPANGKITRVCLAILEYPSANAESFKLTIESGQAKQSLMFSTKKRIEVLDVDYDVRAGDFVTLTTSAAVRSIWTAMLYSIEMSKSQVMSVLIDELETMGGLGDEGV